MSVTEATRTAGGTTGPARDVAAEGARIAGNISRVIQGKDDVVRLALVVLLAEGHLLAEADGEGEPALLVETQRKAADEHRITSRMSPPRGWQ